MRIIGVTQGRSLDVFLGLMEALQLGGDAEPVGVFVSDSAHFRKVEAHAGLLRDSRFEVEKEWEVVAQGLRTPGDPKIIAAYEAEVGEPAWYALLADRRLFFGRYNKRMQAYRPKLSEAQMRGVLTVTLQRIDALLERTRPTVVLAFGTATLGDYLFGRLAPARGLRYLQLKSIKIKNYVSLNDDMVALSRHIAEPFESREASAESRQIAQEYLQNVREQGVKYEGAIKLDTRLKGFRLHRVLPNVARAMALELRRQADPIMRRDNHLDGFLMPALIEGFVQPYRARQFRRRYADRFLGAESLASMGRFAFFPLQFEPEVAIQVFGHPYQNQIEVVRTLALALPADVPLVIKEHPRSIGFRPLKYYEKLMEIPNVRFAEPLLPSIAVVRHAALVAIISGTIGLEAAILGKQVLAFGRPFYCVLPDEIVTKVTDPWKLPDQVRSLLARRTAPDQAPIECLLAASIDGSVAIDLYSTLLGKRGRHRDSSSKASADSQAENLQRLVDYTRKRLADKAGSPVEETSRLYR